MAIPIKSKAQKKFRVHAEENALCEKLKTRSEVQVGARSRDHGKRKSHTVKNATNNAAVERPAREPPVRAGTYVLTYPRGGGHRA